MEIKENQISKDLNNIYMIYKQIKSKENKNKSIEINILLNDKNIFKKMMNSNDNLKAIRNMQRENIKEEFSYVYNDNPINKVNEINYTIKSILTNNNSLILNSCILSKKSE